MRKIIMFGLVLLALISVAIQMNILTCKYNCIYAFRMRSELRNQEQEYNILREEYELLDWHYNAKVEMINILKEENKNYKDENSEQYIKIEVEERLVVFLKDVVILQKAYQRSLKEILRVNGVTPPDFIYTDEEMYRILK